MHTSDNGDCTKLKPLTGVECMEMAIEWVMMR
nr:MAG TPA: hypothetical protein [Caudoviricetes sp.]